MKFPTVLRSPWLWLAAGLLCVYVRGVFLDVMDVDASQYASIAMEMLQNGSWLQVQHRHADYLDKPPLLFWSSALSYALFGIANWSYKLPSVLAALLGVYSVYRFSLRFYNPQTALHAAFILASCAGLVVICNDVRTDTLLLGFSAFAVWQLAEYQLSARWINLLGAATGVGMAMLAKGPIGLVMPALAAGTQVLLTRNWKFLLRWQWLAALLVIALLLAPMCWGLYQQFDLHPEKTVNDRTGVSGLYFYFWEQSFGRITGENIWKNDTSGFYFIHVYQWAFAPWAVLLFGALWVRLRALLRNKGRLEAGAEAYSLGGFLLTFTALSMSKYKLPHYVFITLPWASVLTAQFIQYLYNDAAARTLRRWLRVQLFPLAICLLVALAAVLYIFFPPDAAVGLVFALTLFPLLYAVFRQPLPADASALVQRNVWAALLVAGILNFHFYPRLLPYQSTSKSMQWAKEQGIPAEKTFFYHRHGHSLDFYAGRILEYLPTPDAVQRKTWEQRELWLYTDDTGKMKLDSAGISYNVTASFQHFQAALLKPAFLNPATRSEAVEPVFLLHLQTPQQTAE